MRSNWIFCGYGFLILMAGVLPCPISFGGNQDILYLYGSIPPALDDLRLNDTGNKGFSKFKLALEAEGFTLTQQEAGPGSSFTLTPAVLNNYKVLILSSNNRLFSAAEAQAVADWVNAGGGLIAWSDSAFGRDANGDGVADVSIVNSTIGLESNNSLTQQFGMFFIRDTGGNFWYKNASQYEFPHFIWQNGVADGVIYFWGEGVSPIIVSPPAQFLAKWKNAGGSTPWVRNEDQTQYGATLNNTAGLAIAYVGSGRVVGTFDRNTFWNNGAGTDIDEYDNRQYAKNLVLWAAGGQSPPPEPDPDYDDSQFIDLTDLELFLEQWLEDDCLANAYCDGRDLDKSDEVNLEDLAIFSAVWLYEEELPQFVYEPFDIGAAGQPFWGVETGSTNLGLWGTPADTGASYTVAQPGYTDGGSNVLLTSGVGVRLDTDDDTSGITAVLDTPVTFTDGQSVYVSFLAMNEEPDRQYNSLTFQFNGGNVNLQWSADTADDGYYNLALAEGISGDSGDTIPVDTWFFYVIRIDFSTSGAEAVTVWQNPLLASEPGAGSALITGTAELGSTLNAITAVSKGAITELHFDEVRVGLTYAQVAPMQF